jgi:hypothetical protein
MATLTSILTPGSPKTTKDILGDLSTYEAAEFKKFHDGEEKLSQMQEEYNRAVEANHKALKDLYYEKDEGFKKSQDELFNTVLPQLKLLNELSTLIHAFPHYSIPSVSALTDALKERVNFTLNNIQNFGQAGTIVASDPELAAMVNGVQQRVPYKYVGGDNDDNDDGLIVEEPSDNDTSQVVETTGGKKKTTKKKVRRRKGSKKAQKSSGSI